MGDGEAEPDGPAPVVDDERQPLELELEREALDRTEVRVVRVRGRVERLVRAAEAEEVGGDNAAYLGDRRDHRAVEEPPRRLAVDQEHRMARPLLDVVHSQAVLLDVAGGEGPAREVLESLVRRAISRHAATLRDRG